MGLASCSRCDVVTHRRTPLEGEAPVISADKEQSKPLFGLEKCLQHVQKQEAQTPTGLQVSHLGGRGGVESLGWKFLPGCSRGSDDRRQITIIKKS